MPMRNATEITELNTWHGICFSNEQSRLEKEYMMRKMFAMLLVAAALLTNVSLASEQPQGTDQQGGYTGTQATVPANGGTAQMSRQRYGMRGQAGQNPLQDDAQDDALDGGVFQLMPMLQLFGLDK